MKCPNCDTVNEDNAKFCKTCGINLQVDHTFEENNEKERVSKDVTVHHMLTYIVILTNLKVSVITMII